MKRNVVIAKCAVLTALLLTILALWDVTLCHWANVCAIVRAVGCLIRPRLSSHTAVTLHLSIFRVNRRKRFCAETYGDVAFSWYRLLKLHSVSCDAVQFVIYVAIGPYGSTFQNTVMVQK